MDQVTSLPYCSNPHRTRSTRFKRGHPGHNASKVPTRNNHSPVYEIGSPTTPHNGKLIKSTEQNYQLYQCKHIQRKVRMRETGWFFTEVGKCSRSPRRFGKHWVWEVEETQPQRLLQFESGANRSRWGARKGKGCKGGEGCRLGWGGSHTWGSSPHCIQRGGISSVGALVV